MAAHHISFADAFHERGNVLGRNSNHRQAIRSRVVRPFAAEHHLKVRHSIAGYLAAYAIETEIRNMVLPATVETATNLDVQILNGFIQLHALRREARSQLGC